MTYALILKCKLPDGKISHYVWQTARSSSLKDAQKWVVSEFAINESMKNVGAELLEVIDGAQQTCNSFDESMKLHDSVCKQAEKLDAKAAKKVVEPEKAEAA